MSAARRAGNELGIRHAPFADQSEGGHSRENQHKEMVEEVTNVQEEEVQPVFHGVSLRLWLSLRLAAPPGSAFRLA